MSRIRPVQAVRQDREWGERQAAFVAALYRNYADDLERLAFRRLRDRQLAQDVVQEIFLRVCRSGHAFDPSRPAWPWLSSIAANVIADIGRRRQLGVDTPCGEFDEDPSDVCHPDPADVFQLAQRSQGISEAMASLRGRYRRVLLLKDAEGWSRKDVAAFEGVSEEAVKSMLWRARRAFRQRYEAIAEERGLNGFTLPLLGPLAQKLRAWRDRIGENMSACGLGTVALMDAAGSVAALTLVAALATLGAGPDHAQGSENLGTAPTGLSVPISTESTQGALPPVDRSRSTANGGHAAGVAASVSTHEVLSKSPASAGASGGVERDDRMTLNARIWMYLGLSEPEATMDVEIYCDSDVRQRACESFDELFGDRGKDSSTSS